MGKVSDNKINKVEIMDCAMKLFAEKGYEETTMADIAHTLNISEEEFCTYFKDKQCLYDETLKSYVDLCSEDIIRIFKENADIKDCIRILRNSADSIKSKFKYSYFFDNNKKFHEQLERRMSEKLAPYVADYLKTLKGKGLIHIEDPMVTAKFIRHCEMTIFSGESYAGDVHLTQNKILKMLYEK